MYANAQTAKLNTAMDPNILQALAAQKHACESVPAPRAPVLARIGKLADEINSLSRANLASANGVADTLGGGNPECDGCGEDSLPNGMLEQLERQLQSILGLSVQTSSAIARIERLF